MNRKQEKYVNMLLAFCWRGYPCLYYSLYPVKFPIGKFSAKKTMQHLKITDQKSVKDKLDWYLTIGDRREFYSLQCNLLLLSESEVRELLSNDKDEKTIVKIRIIQQYKHRLNDNSIGAVDITNMLLITKQALKVGLLSPEEAETYEIKGAKLAQSMYTNWKEYLTAFIAGVQFAKESTIEQENYLQKQEKTMIKLMASKHSPFRKIDFKTSFS